MHSTLLSIHAATHEQNPCGSMKQCPDQRKFIQKFSVNFPLFPIFGESAKTCRDHKGGRVDRFSSLLHGDGRGGEGVTIRVTLLSPKGEGGCEWRESADTMPSTPATPASERGRARGGSAHECEWEVADGSFPWRRFVPPAGLEEI